MIYRITKSSKTGPFVSDMRINNIKNLTTLHCELVEPIASQLQASHPSPLAIFQKLGMH